MVDSFQQHNRNKIRILRNCYAINSFLDKLAPYGSEIPAQRTALSQTIRAPFNKTTMSMTSWKLGHDKIEVENIPEEVITLARCIDSGKQPQKSLIALPIKSSSIPLLAFASAPKLSETCHTLQKNLAGLTLKPSFDLIKADHEARKDLFQILRTFLGISTVSILLASVRRITDFKTIPQAAKVLNGIDNIKGFLDEGVVSPSLSLLIPALTKAAEVRKKIRAFSVQGLEPIQIRLALLEGSLFQEDLFDKESIKNATALAHPFKSGPLQRA